MNRLLTIFFLLTALATKADMGPPTVQAICKVTTYDGKTYEGFVALILGGYDGIQQNGFLIYHQNDNYNQTVLFDYTFKKFIRTSYSKPGDFYPKAKQKYFLAYTKDSATYWLKEDKQIKADSSGQYLITETKIHRKYLMLDTLPLFTELPQYLHLDYADKQLKKYNIPMKDISSFEIVLEPSESLLLEIEQKTKACFEIVYAPETTGDYAPPLWVHELVKTPDILNGLKDKFKDEHRR